MKDAYKHDFIIEVDDPDSYKKNKSKSKKAKSIAKNIESDSEIHSFTPEVAVAVVEPVAEVEPVAVVEPKALKKSNQLAETIVINPNRILSKIEPQDKKWWHFKFKNQRDEIALQKTLETMDVTVTYNYCGKKHADVTLTRDNTIGKIHLLHFDRRDKDDPSKYYVKLHFYQFTDATDFDKAKELFRKFFETLSRPQRNIRKTRRSHKIE